MSGHPPRYEGPPMYIVFLLAVAGIAAVCAFGTLMIGPIWL